MKKLTEKQKRFIDYYIETGNATKSALKAGYSKKTAKIIGHENLTKLNIEIQKKLSKKEDNRIAKQDEVLRMLTSAMRGELTEEVVSVIGLGEGYSEVKITEKKVSPKDRIKAAELLGKRYNIFSEKLEIETNNVMIVDDIK